MNKKYRLILAVFVLLLASLACSLLGGSDESQSQAKESKVLFQDNFSDPTSGWERVNNDRGITDYTEDGTYRFLIEESWVDYWANPGLDFKNTVIEVDASKMGGPDDNDFGVICRYQDEENFYFFLISSDGFYAIGKVKDGERSLIEPEQMYPSEEIHTGDAANHLKVVCDDSKLALSVNKEEVAKTEDDTFFGGDVGLIVGAFDESGVDIHFDNFTVREP